MSTDFEEKADSAVSSAAKIVQGRKSAFTLDTIQGQVKAVESLKSYCREAKENHSLLKHTLLSGFSGLGKTVLAEAIAGEMDANLRAVSGRTIASASDLVQLLSQINEGDVLIIEDIHKMDDETVRSFCQALKNFEIGFALHGSMSRRELPHFTVIATTNQIDEVAVEVKSAFDMMIITE